MLAAAARRFAMKVSSPSWSYNTPRVVNQHVLQHTCFSRKRSLVGTVDAFLLRQQQGFKHSCSSSHSGGRHRCVQVFAAWSDHHRQHSHSNSWPVHVGPCRNIFMWSRKREEEEDRSDSACLGNSLSKTCCQPAVTDIYSCCCLQKSHGLLGTSCWQRCSCTACTTF